MKNSAWPSVFVLAVGVFALVFLVAIERQPWFQRYTAAEAAATTSNAADRSIGRSLENAPNRFSRG